MPILVVLIVITFAFYLFYKTKYFRSKRPIERQWLSSKSSIALGIFVALFAINAVYLHQSTVSFIVAAVLLLVGVGSIWAGVRAYRYFLPLVIEESAKQ
ncbi:YtpI family protein [Bacillus sp. PS06]|uniref:YtpI family protein n=1 Tax=Bacillus sp. PS06 TaxID=2764176 RepID=UPI001780179D|nr:YtpI family protein [Bacillus sp. PS06]MBD8068963.1 YtpI family protein [Bacillus sp. PS06]